MIEDASDPKQVRDAIKQGKSREQIAQEGLKAMMSSFEGRAWLHKLLMIADPGRNPFDRNPITMSFNCGEINVTSQVLAEMQGVSLELYLQMIKESKQ